MTMFLRFAEDVANKATDYTGLMQQVAATLNPVSPEWQQFEEQQAYQAQPDMGAAVNWSQPQPQYNYTPPAAPVAQVSEPTAYASLARPADFRATYNPDAVLDPSQVEDMRGLPAFVDSFQNDLAGINRFMPDSASAYASQQGPVSPDVPLMPLPMQGGQLTRAYVDTPSGAGYTSYGNELDPAWLPFMEQEAQQGQADRLAGLNAAGRAIVNMQTPSDLAADPTTPFNATPGVGLLGGLVNALNAYNQTIRQVPGWEAVEDASLNARNRLQGVVAATGEPQAWIYEALGLPGMATASRAAYGGVGEAVGQVVPVTPLEWTIEGIPGIGTIPGVASWARNTDNLAGGIAGAAAREALPELPLPAARAALSNPMQAPASLGGDVAFGRLRHAIAGGAPDAADAVLGPTREILDQAESLVRAGDLKGAKALLNETAPAGAKLPPQWNKASVLTYIDQSRRGLNDTPSPSAAPVPDVAPPPATAAPAQGAAPPAGGGVTAVADRPADADFAANIRLSKYPEDIRGTIKEWADANPDAVQAARRGVQSDADVRAAAQRLVDDVGGDYAKVQQGWKSGQAWNAEEITAIRGTLNSATQRVIDLARESASLENQVRLAEAVLEQQRIQQIVHGVTAEAGRALRAFRQQAAEGMGDVDRMQNLIKVALGSNDQADIALITAGLRGLDMDNPRAVNAFLRSLNKPGFTDYVYEWWLNSILSGPMTQLRNIVGNSVATMTEPVRRTLAAGVDAPLARVQGRQQERFWQEAPAAVFGMVHGIPEGVSGAIKTLTTGFNPAAMGRVEIRKTAFTGPLGDVVRFPTTALEAMDAFFSAVNTRMSMQANAVRMAKREGLKGKALENRIAALLSDPPPSLMKLSRDQSETLLFRNNPGRAANAIANARNSVPGLRYVMPFTRTPANLLKFGVNHSPLGALRFDMWRKLAAGNPEGADEIAQTILGSSVMAGFAGLLATGQIDITAGLPVDSAERDRFYREGKLPFSVKLPGVGWVQYNQIPVLDVPLTLLGSVAQGVRDGDDAIEVSSQSLATIGQSLMDKSYLSGLDDFFSSVRDPERALTGLGARTAQGFIPYSAALRQGNNVFDNSVKSPDGLQESLMVGVPGLSQMVPTRLNAFGQEVQRGNSPLSPIGVSAAKQTAVDAELERLGMEVGFVGSTINNKKLSRDEQRTYQLLAGQMTEFALESIISSESYQKLGDLERQTVIDAMITRSRSEMRKLLGSDEWAELSAENKQAVIDAFVARFQR